MDDDDFIEDNARELQRLRALVGRLTDDQLRAAVNEHWTVAAVLGHVAFWDARALYLVEHFDPATGFPDDVDEPRNVDWINDSTRPLIHAIDPREAAELTLRLAEQIDAGVAGDPGRQAVAARPRLAAQRTARITPGRASRRDRGRAQLVRLFGVATSLRRSERATRIASPAATVTNPATEASKKTLHTTSSDFAFEISGPPTASPTIPTPVPAMTGSRTAHRYPGGRKTPTAPAAAIAAPIKMNDHCIEAGMQAACPAGQPGGNPVHTMATPSTQPSQRPRRCVRP